MRKLFLTIVTLVLLGCSRSVDTTTTSTAVGGALGAGLGAIIGSQTGEPFAGTLIGLVAGSGTGALIGNSLDSQEQKIIRNEESVKQQQHEIDQLRRDSQDISVSKSVQPKLPSNSEPTNQNFNEADILVFNESPVEKQQEQSNISSNQQFNSGECQAAEQEVSNARNSEDLADKLFHQRKALRLCPGNPSLHNGLGEIYLSMDRDQDATYEFEQALKLDPSYEVAKKNLEIIK